MPRIPASVQRLATRQDKLLTPLLKECRDLPSAQNELRWLREHAAEEGVQAKINKGTQVTPVAELRNYDTKLSRLEALVKRRAAGEPLQYILGNQPFGDLDILCEPKVLIPRPETETYTTMAVKALVQSDALGRRVDGAYSRSKLRVLDLCTGTGAIALLLHEQLRKDFSPPTPQPPVAHETSQPPLSLQILGIDVSPDAIRLARRNLAHNVKQNLLHKSADHDVQFREFDVSKLGLQEGTCKRELANLVGPTPWDHGDRWDVLVCNPPYVAPDDYAVGGRTERSVRNHEPRLALVPPPSEGRDLHPGDTFYPVLLRIARQVSASLIIMEVGDTAQAERVKTLIGKLKLRKVGPPLVETWYDDGSMVTEKRPKPAPEDQDDQVVDPKSPRPTASARAVVLWRGKWAARREKLLYPSVRRVFATKESDDSEQIDTTSGSRKPSEAQVLQARRGSSKV